MFQQARNAFRSIDQFLRIDGYIDQGKVDEMGWSLVPVLAPVSAGPANGLLVAGCKLIDPQGISEVIVLADDELQKPFKVSVPLQNLDLSKMRLEYSLGPFILTTESVAFVILAFDDYTLIAGPKDFCEMLVGFPAEEGWMRLKGEAEEELVHGVARFWWAELKEIYLTSNVDD